MKIDNESKDRVELPDITLKHAFFAMMYVAREEGQVLEEKYEKMFEYIHTYNELGVTDMMDNLENMYVALRATGLNEIEYDNEDERYFLIIKQNEAGESGAVVKFVPDYCYVDYEKIEVVEKGRENLVPVIVPLSDLKEITEEQYKNHIPF